MIRRQGAQGRALALILGLASAMTVLAACSSTSGESIPQSPASAPALAEQPSPGVAPAAEVTISTDSLTGHIHNVVLHGGTIFLGTHDGIWSQLHGQQPQRVSAEGFDVMGLTRTGSTWLASGHPGPEMQAPANLGLGISTDGGRTWVKGSLGGQVDFHRLVAQGAVVLGIDSGDGVLWRTDNMGRTWDKFGTPSLFDLAIAPDNTAIVIGTTQNGVVRSLDGGSAFTLDVEGPLLALLSATADGVYGAGADGAIYFSADAGKTWQPRGTVSVQPSALSAEGSTVVALVGHVIVESRDGGRSFHDRLSINGVDDH